MSEHRATVEWQRSGEFRHESYSRNHTIRFDGFCLTGRAAPENIPPASRTGPGVDPEQAFVGSLSACHMLTYFAICARKGIRVVAYEDGASGTMALEGGGGHFTEVVLRPKVTLAAGSDARAAEALHEEAHKNCFIAASVNFPVRHEAETTVAER